MGIEQAFGFGREAEIVYVNKGADYRPYEKRIAYLEGQVEGYKMAYDRDIAELTDVAKQNKEVSTANRIVADLFKDVLRDFVAQGRMTRAEVNVIKDKLIEKLPAEEQRLICD